MDLVTTSYFDEDLTSPPKESKPIKPEDVQVDEGAFLTKGKEAKTKQRADRNKKPDIDLAVMSKVEMEFYGDLFRENTEKLLQVG